MQAAPRRRDRWPKGLKLVHQAITAAVLESGLDHRVGGDGPTVKAVIVQTARAIHKQRYVSSGDGDRNGSARKAWARNFKVARGSGLISGELREGQELIWPVA